MSKLLSPGIHRRLVSVILLVLWAMGGTAIAATDTFFASGTWIAPAGVTSITVEAWGGGGGGGAATGNPAKGGGGAGGQYAKKLVAVTSGSPYTVVVGAGGTGGNGATGGSGGNSTFAGTTVVARGGAGGGLASTNNSGGTGGVGAVTSGVGDVVNAGGDGSDGVASGTGGAGGGGAGSTGSGGSASGNTAGSGTAAGGGVGATGLAAGTRASCTSLAAVAGGGGCGGSATNSTNQSGGAGAAGKVLVTYTAPPVATTAAATTPTTISATLNGAVTSNDAATAVTFVYGLTTAYGSTATATPASVAPSTTATAVSAAITGLTCGTLYHYKVVGVSSVGTANGSDLTFTTSVCPAVTSISTATSSPIIANMAVSWTVIFNTSVTGVDAADFALVPGGGVTGATMISVTGSGTTWTVLANTGNGTGTLGLNLVDNDTIINAASVPLGGAGSGNFTGQVYTVTPPFCSPPPNIPAGVSVSCVCDTFARATLNPSTIFNSNWNVSTSDATGILPSIVNSGYLRLTNNTSNNAKAATVPGIFPAAGNYISVEFQQYAYSGSGADGIAVTLSDYAVPAVPGAFGGSSGYAQKGQTPVSDCPTAGGCPGFAGGWLGVALDEYGGFQYLSEGRSGGTGARVPQSVGVRGSGSGMTGYNYLTGSGTFGGVNTIDNAGSSTASRGYYYQVVVDARNDPASTAIAVNRDTGGGYASIISIPNVYTAATAQGFTQAPVPTNWQISFTGSTGGSTNIHEIGGLRICATTIVPPSGGTASGFNAVDEAYGTPPSVAVQNYLNGHIYTKLVGVTFKLNVAALTNSQIVTTYAAGSAKTVTVKLVDNSDSLTDSTKDCTLSCTSTCTSKTAVTGGTQNLIFASGATDKGQKQSTSFTINSAYQKLVAIISDGTTAACSTDSFSVRPLSIASVTSTDATNAGTSGAPTIKAGSGNFSLTATTTGVVGSPSGYNGVIKINTAAVQVASPATVLGTLTGTAFPAATPATPASTATGTTFTYSEVGGFKLPGYSATDTTSSRSVYDDTWTAVDSISTKGDCVANNYSNTKNSNGKYGCNFGLLTTSSVFGRFIPDHFNTVVTQVAGVPLPCPDGSCPTAFNGFVYSGQPFSLTVTAKNASDVTTTNYSTATGFAKSTALSSWGVLGTTTAPTGAGALGVASVTAFVAGTLTEPAEKYTFTTTPTAPTNIYIRASDGEVSSLRVSNPTTTSIEGGVKVLSGRIKIPNVYGSERLALPITVTVQYYLSGSTWLPSLTDSATAFNSALTTATPTPGNVLLASPSGLGSPAGSAVSVVNPATSAVASGVRTFSFAAPATPGHVSVSINSPIYLPSTTGVATFGIFRSSLIYRRENY